ncbi:hypothetical protein TMatcc_010143 [Talaromyces marneffei ATCC 18224]
MTTKALSACQVRWYEFLQEFHFILKYRLGKSNVLADTLTWRRDEEARNLDSRNLVILLKEKLDNRILAELALIDMTKKETTGNVIERVLAANEEFTGTEQA